MTIKDLIMKDDVESFLKSIITEIHLKGPIEIYQFEQLAYLKKFHTTIFDEYEKALINVLGLFYKVSHPVSFMDEIYSILADTLQSQTGERFTPVQADAFTKIGENIYFSFSAPTSAGKSFLFREIIKKATNDIVIIVPSRALIAEYIHELVTIVDKSVLVLQFIEIVNVKRTTRRIYVITPERGIELFKHINDLNIELFLFDEAQIADEEIRGMKFDSFVRRADRLFPKTKKVFTHPFILNPEAQLSKHNFTANSDSYCYKQNSVGKIYLSIKNNVFRYFSPFEIGEEFTDSQEDIVEETLKNDGTILIYTSKSKIYDGTFRLDFHKYLSLCNPITKPKALEYINILRNFIGASAKGGEKHSTLIEMMAKGIVIHHGSIPLKARLIIENFVNEGFAKICFSTSTLIQGINMPFDVVWINNFKFSGTENQKNLDLKNLIGRAGRTSSNEDSFDFGYVVIESRNTRTFKSRIAEPSVIRGTSTLDDNISNIPQDMVDIVEALKTGTFNDELHLTDKQVSRIEEANLDEDIEYILDNLLTQTEAISALQYYKLGQSKRTKIKTAFKNIFISHLRRKDLTKSEKSILSASIPMLLWQIQGKSFAEIVSLRHSFLTNKSELSLITRQVKRKEITSEQGAELRSKLNIRVSPMASPIPNITVRAINLFNDIVSVEDIDYDKIVYDTYDYLDKVIGLSLTDPLCAAFQMYYNNNLDSKALIMRNYIRYGTNDSTEIWLLKYGFGFDDIEWIQNYVLTIDENEITFTDQVNELDADRLQTISRFI